MNDRSSHNSLSFPQGRLCSLAPGHELRISFLWNAMAQTVHVGKCVWIDDWRSPALLNRPDRTDGLLLRLDPRLLHLRKDAVQPDNHLIDCVQLLLENCLLFCDRIPASRISYHQFYNTSLACDSSTTGQGSSSQTGKLSKQAWLSIEKLVEVIEIGMMIPIEIANCGHLQASDLYKNTFSAVLLSSEISSTEKLERSFCIFRPPQTRCSSRLPLPLPCSPCA